MVDRAVVLNRRVLRELRKQVQITQGGATGFTTVPDGYEEVQYEASIDVAALDSMGRKAARNKSGKAVDGPLVVKVVSRRRCT